MPKFDWNRFPAEGAAPTAKGQKFNWNDFPAEGEPTGDPRPAEAFVTGYGNRLTSGHLPQIQAMTDPLIDRITVPIVNAIEGTDIKPRSFAQSVPGSPEYVRARDEEIRKREKLYQENPGAYGAGAVVGTVNQAGALSGVLPSGGASAAARIGKAAASGAIMGGAENPGDKEGVVDPLQLGDRAGAAAVGGALGATSQGVVEGVIGTKDAILNAAARRAAKATGLDKREARKLIAAGKLDQYGKEINDSGILSGLPNSEDIAARAASEKSKVGKQIGDFIDDLDARASQAAGGAPASAQQMAAQGARQGSAGISRATVADALEKTLIQDAGLPGVDGENKAMQGLIDEFKQGKDLSIREAQDLKTKVKKLINYDRLPGADIPPKEQFYRKLVGNLSQGIEDASTALATGSGKEDLAKLQALKSRYGAMSDAARISEKKSAGDIANRILSPSDYLTGGAGLAAGFASGDGTEDRLKKAALGASLGLANKFGRTYGNQVAAQGLSQVAKVIPSIPKLQELISKHPEVLQQLEARLLPATGMSGGFEPRAAFAGGASAPSAGVPETKPARGEDRWAQSGLNKLGIADDALASRLMQSKQGKRLLIEASDLPAGSAGSKRILAQIQKGWGS